MPIKPACILLILTLALHLQTFSQESPAPLPQDQEYLRLKKSSRGLIIGGSVSMGVGMMAMVYAAALATAEILPAMFGQEPQYQDEANAGAIVGTVLFLGGAGILTAGLIKNGKANRMMYEKLSIRPLAPPIQVTDRAHAQAGFTLRWSLGGQ